MNLEDSASVAAALCAGTPTGAAIAAAAAGLAAGDALSLSELCRTSAQPVANQCLGEIQAAAVPLLQIHHTAAGPPVRQLW